MFADEVERRDRSSAGLRARAAKLDPVTRLETFTGDSTVRYDRQLWNELCSLRFLDDARGTLILGPVGVGKTHLATALGHIAVRRRRTVRFLRADQMFRLLKAASLDNSVDAEMRALARVDVLILDNPPSPRRRSPPRPAHAATSPAANATSAPSGTTPSSGATTATGPAAIGIGGPLPALRRTRRHRRSDSPTHAHNAHRSGRPRHVGLTNQGGG